MKKLELRLANPDPKYLEKWQEKGTNDFRHLYVDGEKVSDQLYRIGGFGAKLDQKYFMILKYVEAHYDKSILEVSGNKNSRHLAGHWCIIDNNGIEKVVFDQFKTPYLQGGVIYSLDNRYYNIETGEAYAGPYCSTISSEKHLFIENKYDDDPARIGVIQVNKEDGSYVIIK